MSLPLGRPIERFLRFSVVGAVGFAADAAALLAVVTVVHVPPVPARVLSFLFAATITFALNRRFTFGAAGGRFVRQWIRYLVTTAGGATVNFLVYLAWVTVFGARPWSLLAGTAVGSVTAMMLNFTVSSRIIFRSDARTPAS